MGIFTCVSHAANGAIDAPTADFGTRAPDAAGGSGHAVALPIAERWVGADTDKTRIRIDLGAIESLRPAVDLVALVNHTLPAGQQIRLRVSDAPEESGLVEVFGGWSIGEHENSDLFFAGAPRYPVDGAPWWRPRREFVNAVEVPAQRRLTATGHSWRPLTRPDKPGPPVSAQHRWRYWWVDFPAATANYAVGLIVLGARWQAPIQYQPGWTRARLKTVRTSPTDLGTPLVGRVLSTGWRLGFEWLLDASRNETADLETFLDSLDLAPALIIPDDERPECYFGRLENPAEPWTVAVAADNGPDRLSTTFLTDHEGFDFGA